GSAIQGPARADLYWGAGDDAGKVAGRFRHQGRFVMLLPRELDIVEAGKRMPLPRPKPVISEAVASPRSDTKGNAEHGKPEPKKAMTKAAPKARQAQPLRPKSPRS